MPVAVCCTHVPPWFVLMNKPTGSGAPPVPCKVVYRTCTPPGLTTGLVGGARETTTFEKPPVPTAAATTAVAELRTWVQFCPPSLDRKTPRPEIPAYRRRALAGAELSNTSVRASPHPLLPAEKFRPPSVERNRPPVAPT